MKVYSKLNLDLLDVQKFLISDDFVGEVVNKILYEAENVRIEDKLKTIFETLHIEFILNYRLVLNCLPLELITPK
jgi:hypothetical protein